jgi:hypothetical protein
MAFWPYFNRILNHSVSRLLFLCAHAYKEGFLPAKFIAEKRPKVFGCAQIIYLLNAEQNHLTRLPIALPMRNVGRANVTDPMRYLVRSQTCCVVCHTCRFFQPPALPRFIARSSPLCGHYVNGLLALMIFFLSPTSSVNWQLCERGRNSDCKTLCQV